jgi:hypothetical protein
MRERRNKKRNFQDVTYMCVGVLRQIERKYPVEWRMQHVRTCTHPHYWPVSVRKPRPWGCQYFSCAMCLSFNWWLKHNWSWRWDENFVIHNVIKTNWSRSWISGQLPAASVFSNVYLVAYELEMPMIEERFRVRVVHEIRPCALQVWRNLFFESCKFWLRLISVYSMPNFWSAGRPHNSMC